MYAAASSRYEMVYDMLLDGAEPTFSTPKSGNALVSVLRRSRAEPGTPLYEWLIKVKDLLKTKGLDVDAVR